MENLTSQNKRLLPNSNAVLVLGILSIVFGCFGIGLVLGIVGLYISREGKLLNEQNPSEWSGFGNLNAGRIMSIIGICLGGLSLLYFVFWIVLMGAIVGTAAGGWGNIFN